MIQKSMQKTASRWKRHIQRILNKVYQDLYDNEDFAWMYAHFFSEELNTGSSLSQRFIGAYKKRAPNKKKKSDSTLSQATALGGDSWELIAKGAKQVTDAHLVPATDNRLPALVGTNFGEIRTRLIFVFDKN